MVLAGYWMVTSDVIVKCCPDLFNSDRGTDILTQRESLATRRTLKVKRLTLDPGRQDEFWFDHGRRILFASDRGSRLLAF